MLKVRDRAPLISQPLTLSLEATDKAVTKAVSNLFQQS